MRGAPTGLCRFSISNCSLGRKVGNSEKWSGVGRCRGDAPPLLRVPVLRPGGTALFLALDDFRRLMQFHLRSGQLLDMRQQLSRSVRTAANWLRMTVSSDTIQLHPTVGNFVHHSAPRARLGSILVARRTGNSVAATTHPNRSVAALASVAGSEAVTP
jgi:hypothetical protein